MSSVEPSRSDAKANGPIVMPRTPPLDGLRAIAVIIVVLAHGGLEKIVPGGFGVTIFFFLSGYLITTLLRFELQREGKVTLRDFYLRRVARIFPPLYITILFALLMLRAGLVTDPVDPIGVVNQALFLTNYGDLWGPNKGLPIPLWSLAVEEHFYLLFPLCFALWLGRMDGRKAAALCLGACAAILLVRTINVMMLEDYSRNYIWSHTRMDSILFGCVLALWNNPLLDAGAYRPRPWHVGLALFVLLLCFAVRGEAFRQSLRYTLQSGALFVLFSFALQDRGIIPRILSSALLARIALYSYTIYLVHPILLDPRLQQALAIPFVPPFLLSTVLIAIYAALMYAVVERPAAALRKRLHDHRRSRAMVRAGAVAGGA